MSLTLSIHTRHDANMTISSECEIVRYIEFEKVTKKRHFSFSLDDAFEKEVHDVVLPMISDIKDEIKTVNFCWLTEYQKEFLSKMFTGCNLKEKRHHLSHAYSLYAFTEMRDGDLIISCDGGGDEEDFFKIFEVGKGKIVLIHEVKLNLGTPYRLLGLLSDETRSSPGFMYESNLQLPGKIMALCCLGKVQAGYEEPIIDFYKRFNKFVPNIKNELLRLLGRINVAYDPNLKVDKDVCRNILRTSQSVFETLFLSEVQVFVDAHRYRRILLTGGCSLNIKLNTALFERTRKEIFVSPVSGDCGVSIGAAVSDIAREKFKPFKNAFIGPTAENAANNPYLHHGKTSNFKEIAHLLSTGKIVAVFVGEIEAGPRALGHRSLLASPLVKGMKNRLNEIKEREFFRPVACATTATSQKKYFSSGIDSKYMTFCSEVNDEVKSIMTEATHFDGTCRIQTVTVDNKAKM